jgi:hypothetical protein
VPQYADDGTLIGVIERRGRPQTAIDSGGEEVETDLELRAVPDGAAIREAGSADGYPTRLVHPDGRTFRVLDAHEEDGGVTIDFTVEEGPEVDIIVLPEDQYERFRSGQTWRAKPGTVVGRSGGGTEQVSLPPGTYFVLVDNSSQGVAYASPTRKDNPATVSFEIEIWASPPSDEE